MHNFTSKHEMSDADNCFQVGSQERHFIYDNMTSLDLLYETVVALITSWQVPHRGQPKPPDLGWPLLLWLLPSKHLKTKYLHKW